jgi:hypothetical protein
LLEKKDDEHPTGKEIIKHCDVDKNGKISIDEGYKCAKAQKVPDEEIQAIKAIWPKGEDGKPLELDAEQLNKMLDEAYGAKK